MGAAGDMLSAALLGLCPDREAMLAKLNAIGIHGVEYVLEPATKCGIAALHLSVRVHGHEEGEEHHESPISSIQYPVSRIQSQISNLKSQISDFSSDSTISHHHHHHEHRSLKEVMGIIDGLALPPAVADDVRAVYALIGEAEAKAHGGNLDAVHFHEVGALDAIADISATALLIAELKPDRIVASPVNCGSGFVHCAHGVLPVPAPCTAELLEGVPSHMDPEIDGELCTPTGAALVRHFAESFGPMPAMALQGVGYGAGKKDFDKRANFLRAFIGEEPAGKPAGTGQGEAAVGFEAGTGQGAVKDAPQPAGTEQGTVCQFRCSIDDMTAEEFGFAAERIMADGALDVCMIPALMKKGRPGTILEVLCRTEDRDAIAASIFRNTTTIGLREETVRRRVLERREDAVETPLGRIRRKFAFGEGVAKAKAEYEDLAAAARIAAANLDIAQRREGAEKQG
jgi:uncharacterized protein (TIGR00299 family) protein